MNKWIVQDWAGNVLFGGKEFDSFEDGWGYVREVDPITDEDERAHDDYYVVRKYRQAEVQVTLTFMLNTDEVDSETTVEEFAISNYGDYEHAIAARVTWVGDPR